jgi:hypothetical protein
MEAKIPTGLYADQTPVQRGPVALVALAARFMSFLRVNKGALV